MSFSAVGSVWDLEGFRAYVGSLPALDWADSVTVHHTGTPDLSQRPKGWTIQHMRNLAHYYGKQLGWSSGPHLFTDEDQIFGLSPMTRRGVHARSFNAHSIGLEMLGNYDKEDPGSGRGRSVLELSQAAVAILLEKLGKPATDKTILFHRDDPRTSKTCPGSLINKSAFVGAVARIMESRGGTEDAEPRAAFDVAEIMERVRSAEWQLAKIREELG